MSIHASGRNAAIDTGAGAAAAAAGGGTEDGSAIVSDGTEWDGAGAAAGTDRVTDGDADGIVRETPAPLPATAAGRGARGGGGPITTPPLPPPLGRNNDAVSCARVPITDRESMKSRFTLSDTIRECVSAHLRRDKQNTMSPFVCHTMHVLDLNKELENTLRDEGVRTEKIGGVPSGSTHQFGNTSWMELNISRHVVDLPTNRHPTIIQLIMLRKFLWSDATPLCISIVSNRTYASKADIPESEEGRQDLPTNGQDASSHLN